MPFPADFYRDHASTFRWRDAPEKETKARQAGFQKIHDQIESSGGRAFCVVCRWEDNEPDRPCGINKWVHEVKKHRHDRYHAAGQYVASGADVLISIDDPRHSSGAAEGSQGIAGEKLHGRVPALLDFDHRPKPRLGAVFCLRHPRRKKPTNEATGAPDWKHPLTIQKQKNASPMAPEFVIGIVGRHDLPKDFGKKIEEVLNFVRESRKKKHSLIASAFVKKRTLGLGDKVPICLLVAGGAEFWEEVATVKLEEGVRTQLVVLEKDGSESQEWDSIVEAEAAKTWQHERARGDYVAGFCDVLVSFSSLEEILSEEFETQTELNPSIAVEADRRGTNRKVLAVSPPLFASDSGPIINFYSPEPNSENVASGTEPPAKCVDCCEPCGEECEKCGTRQPQNSGDITVLYPLDVEPDKPAKRAAKGEELLRKAVRSLRGFTTTDLGSEGRRRKIFSEKKRGAEKFARP